MEQPAGLSLHRKPERKSVGWVGGQGCVGREGGWQSNPYSPTLLCSLYILTHIFPKVWRKSCTFVCNKDEGEVGRSSKAFLKAGKHTYCCPYGTQREWTQCTQETREGVYVTVRQCAPVLQRMQGPEESGLNP